MQCPNEKDISPDKKFLSQDRPKSLGREEGELERNVLSQKENHFPQPQTRDRLMRL